MYVSDFGWEKPFVSFPEPNVLSVGPKSTGNMKYSLLLTVLAVSLCLVGLSTALSFDSTPNVIKCFREQLSRHQVVSGEVGGPSSPFQTLKYWVCANGA